MGIIKLLTAPLIARYVLPLYLPNHNLIFPMPKLILETINKNTNFRMIKLPKPNPTLEPLVNAELFNDTKTLNDFRVHYFLKPDSKYNNTKTCDLKTDYLLKSIDLPIQKCDIISIANKDLHYRYIFKTLYIGNDENYLDSMISKRFTPHAVGLFVIACILWVWSFTLIIIGKSYIH
jgi:hypothetical protein